MAGWLGFFDVYERLVQFSEAGDPAGTAVADGGFRGVRLIDIGLVQRRE